MEELDAEEKAFQNKFSRQIATMGLAAVRKLVKMKVLIVGCGGVGAETAKNVILQGTRAVTLYDPVCQCCRSSLGVLAKLSEGRLNMQTSQQLSF
jgi:tRNA A37 threonylcarbamoyladenosine dehydratase